MRTLHLFAGAGGGLLADLILGHEPVCAVEWDAYCCAVLRERADEGWFPGLHVFEGDVRLFPASDWAGRVDCVHAGFPCQPHSVAGKRRGAEDDRNLWPEVVRVLREVRPEWAFLENVPGIVSNRFIGTVLGDLAQIGFDARWTLLGADQVGAPHKRERWWCLAHAGGTRRREDTGGAHAHEIPHGRRPTAQADQFDGDGEGCGKGHVAHAASAIGEQHRTVSDGEQDRSSDGSWWSVEPDLGRVVDGMAARVDQLKALGNGQVPLQAAFAFRVLMGGVVSSLFCFRE